MKMLHIENVLSHKFSIYFSSRRYILLHLTGPIYIYYIHIQNISIVLYIYDTLHVIMYVPVSMYIYFKIGAESSSIEGSQHIFSVLDMGNFYKMSANF